MKTIIKYAHGNGYGKNLASITVATIPRTTSQIQNNLKKAHPTRRVNGQDQQML